MTEGGFLFQVLSSNLETFEMERATANKRIIKGHRSMLGGSKKGFLILLHWTNNYKDIH